MSMINLFIIIAGFVIGLGAVTVIDIHGFLGRKSEYWTEATTRTHKVTKPLIWIGIFLVVLGGTLFYRGHGFSFPVYLHLISLPLMILNGIFLSFSVSPYLLKREREGISHVILPRTWQNKITLSFLLSFVLWWGNLVLFLISV